MIKFFSKGFFVQYAVVFILGTAIWIPAFLTAPVSCQTNSYWGPVAILLNNLFVYLGYGATVLAYLIIFSTGILVNNMAGRFNISEKSGIFPLFLFVILSSCFPSLTALSPITLALPLIVLLFIILLKHSEKEETILSSLDAGIITGFLALIYYPLALLIIMIWFTIITLTKASWRNFIASILGIAFPAFLIYVYFFFSIKEDAFLDQANHIGFITLNPAFLSAITFDTITTLVMVAFVLISAIKVMQQQQNLTILQRGYLFLLGIYILVIFAINLLFSTQLITVLLFAPAGALTLNSLLSDGTKPKWVNLSLSLFLIIVFLNTWHNYLYATQ